MSMTIFLELEGLQRYVRARLIKTRSFRQPHRKTRAVDLRLNILQIRNRYAIVCKSCINFRLPLFAGNLLLKALVARQVSTPM